MSTQHWDPSQYAEHARYVSDLGMPVVELLAPRTGERILDLGCGDGALTIKLVEQGCSVVGVDSSLEMVSAARSLGLDARLIDAADLTFTGEFDAVFSNAALHWMKDPGQVIAGVFRSLKPGGRFVGEFGGYNNVATILSALEAALNVRGIVIPCPWYFPRPEEFRRILEDAGFVVLTLDHFPRPTPLPGGMAGWLEIFAQPYTAALPPAKREPFISEVVNSLRPALCDADGRWTADYVRLRFSALRPGLESTELMIAMSSTASGSSSGQAANGRQ
jgi:trans-aconitate methyltransferase